MSGAWSRLPFDRIVRRADLGNPGKNLSENNGEARRVCLLEKYPGWVFKEYLSPVPLHGVKRLDRLINLPGQMTPAERALVDGHTSWPASRVLDAQKTIGVVMPLAPSTYSTERQLAGGRKEQRVLEVDMLALTDDQQRARKLPPQALTDRISVCASIAAVAALFERHGLVYLDWSYANIFWSLDDHSAYVIDMDGCSFGPRPQIQTHNWDDPQVPLGQPAGNESDRYRVALLIARCLTGLRSSVADTRSGLVSLSLRQGAISELAGLLVRALKDGSATERPSTKEMSKVLQAAMGTGLRPRPGTASVAKAGGGVTGWKSVKAGTRGDTSPKVKAHVPPAPPATAPRPPKPAVTPQTIASVPLTVGRAGRSPGTTSTRPGASTQSKPQYTYAPSSRSPSGTPARAPSSGGGVVAAVLILILIVVVIAIII